MHDSTRISGLRAPCSRPAPMTSALSCASSSPSPAAQPAFSTRADRAWRHLCYPGAVTRRYPSADGVPVFDGLTGGWSSSIKIPSGVSKYSQAVPAVGPVVDHCGRE
jgi:hypothetical protein